MLLLLVLLLPLNWMYIDLFLAFVTIFHSIVVVVVVTAVCPLVPQLRAKDFLFVCCFFFFLQLLQFRISSLIYIDAVAAVAIAAATVHFFPC